MSKRTKWVIGLVILLIILIFGGFVINHYHKVTTVKKQAQQIQGVYKTPSKVEDGTSQPDYWYFEKNGKLMYCTPEVKSSNGDTWYGDASRGTWKSLGNNMYQIKMHSVYDSDYYTIKAKLNGNKLHTYALPKTAKFSWRADNSTKQTDMTKSEYMSMFRKAEISDQKGIKDVGYIKPDNSSSSSSSNDTSSTMTFDQAAKLIQKGNFSDFDYDRDSQTHDGSHATSNGGYVMITYPGAKGEDRYTITKTGSHKYHITAEYGSSDGGFTKFDDQSDYGPTSADVTD